MTVTFTSKHFDSRKTGSYPLTPKRNRPSPLATTTPPRRSTPVTPTRFPTSPTTSSLGRYQVRTPSRGTPSRLDTMLSGKKRSPKTSKIPSPGANGDKICFLDVDGVLHSYFARNDSQLFNRSCMRRLKRIVDETGCKIVLSSSWRKTPQGKTAVNQQLRSNSIPSIIGCTRVRYDEYQRHEDILDWIEKNPTERWIAIDDLPMPQLREHYIQTAPDVGLTDAAVHQAIRVLNK